MFAIYLQHIIYICIDTLYIYIFIFIHYIYTSVNVIYILYYIYTYAHMATLASWQSPAFLRLPGFCRSHRRLRTGCSGTCAERFASSGASLGHKDRLRWGWSRLIRPLNMARLLRFPWKKWCSIAMFVYQRVSPILGMMSYDSFQLMI
jgi:hypothetical protein